MRIRTAFTLLLIIVLAIILRVHNLSRIAFWEDELFTLYRSQLPVIETLKNLAAYPIFPPLYYLLTSVWVKIFGINEFMLRYPSLIFSVLSVFFIFKLGEILYNARVGLCAALLLAISPYSIYYAQEAKMYAMSWALSIVSFWLFLRLIKKSRPVDYAAYVLVNTVSWYSSYLGIMYSIIQGISLFIFKKQLSFKKWVGLNLIIVILFLPWLGRFFGQVIHPGGIGWVPATGNYFIRAAQHICTIQLLPFNKPRAVFGIIIYICAIFFSLVKFSKNSRFKMAWDFGKEDIMLLIWFVLPFITYFLVDMFWCRVFSMGRYIGFIHIPLLLLICRGICRFKFWLRFFIIILIVYATFTVSLNPYYSKCKKISDQRWAQVFHSIKSVCPKGSLVITFLPDYCLKYYNNDLPMLNMYSIGRTYEGGSFESVFVVFNRSLRQRLDLPQYSLIKQWDIGNLRVKRYKRSGKIGG